MELNESELLERLADLEHDQWVTLTKYFIHLLYEQNNGYDTIEDCIEYLEIKYDRLLSLPYEAMTEEEKEKDRVFARKVMELLKKINQ